MLEHGPAQRLFPTPLAVTPSPDGTIHVLPNPGPLAWPGDGPRWDGGGVQAIPPLVAYAELLDQHTDRALTAATELRERW